MLKKSIFAVISLAAVLGVMSPPPANAAVVVGVGIGPVVARPYVIVHPRPYAYYYGPPRPYVYAPVHVYPGPGYYVGGRWYPRYYAYRPYVAPRPYWRR